MRRNIHIDDVMHLIDETESYAKKLRYLKGNKKLRELSTINIETIIAKIESELHSSSYINYLIIPIGLLFSMTVSILTISAVTMKAWSAFSLMAYATIIPGLMLITGFIVKENSRRKVYFKHLLLLYLKYQRCDMVQENDSDPSIILTASEPQKK